MHHNEQKCILRKQISARHTYLADQGYTTALINLGNCCEFGRGVAQDMQQAALLYQRALALGDTRAQTYLNHVQQKLARAAGSTTTFKPVQEPTSADTLPRALLALNLNQTPGTVPSIARTRSFSSLSDAASNAALSDVASSITEDAPR
jgi:hypothetical protein